MTPEGFSKGTFLPLRAHKYTLIDLVENINTDVKSEVADFDFEGASKTSVVSNYERKIA